MNIRMNNMQRSYDDNWDTVSIEANFSSYDNGQTFNATVVLTNDDLKNGQTLDSLNPKEVNDLAKAKIVSWLEPTSTIPSAATPNSQASAASSMTA